MVLWDLVLRTGHALLWSAMEVEIEGPCGWASMLPTTTVLGTSFTWYHVYMNSIVCLTAAAWWSDGSVVRAVHRASSWFLLQDTAWFLLNPHFGVARYTRRDVPWHAAQPWPLGVPLHNFGLAGLMGICAWWTHAEGVRASEEDGAPSTLAEVAAVDMLLEIPWDAAVLLLLALWSRHRHSRS